MKNIISIIIIIISLATFVLVVKPQYTEIKDLEVKKEELGEVLKNAKKLQSIRDTLLNKRKTLSLSDVSRLEKLIPENADNVKLIIEFQRIAEKYDLELQAASASRDDAEEVIGGRNTQNFDIESRDYGVITLDFIISGGYSEFLSFLDDIENNLRITDLRTLSISTGESQQFDFSIAIDTYWLKDNI